MYIDENIWVINCTESEIYTKVIKLAKLKKLNVLNNMYLIIIVN